MSNDNTATIALHTNSSTYATILTRSSHLEVAHILLGHKLGVGVQVRDHTLRTIAHKVICGYIIDILERDLAHKINHNLHIAAQAKVIARSPHTRNDNCRHGHHYAIPLYSFHHNLYYRPI